MKYALLAIIVCCVSCTYRKTVTVQCENGSLQLYPTGFGPRDFDSAFVVTFVKNGKFNKTVDTVPIGTYSSVNDTGYIRIYDSIVTGAYGLAAGYDYKIILPAINKTYLVTDVTQTGMKHRTLTYTAPVYSDLGITDPPCFNSIFLCKINGVKYLASQDVSYSSSRMYFPK